MSNKYSVDQFLVYLFGLRARLLNKSICNYSMNSSNHILAGRENSIRSDIQEDAGWDVHALIEATNILTM